MGRMDKELIYKFVFYSKKLLNGLLFYVGWFICVIAAAKNRPEWALVATVAIVAAHFILYDKRWKDFILLVVLSSAGLLIDTFFLWAGWISYQSPNRFFIHLAPLWIVCLHAIFSTTINHSLAWLKNYLFASSFLGAGGIAWTYLAGQRLGAIDLLLPNFLSLLAIGCVWFFYLPCVYWFSLQLDKKYGE